MYAKAPWTVIRRAMHIHPTVSELVPTMLSELRRWTDPFPSHELQPTFSTSTPAARSSVASVAKNTWSARPSSTARR
jgi:hypothetical protein